MPVGSQLPECYHLSLWLDDLKSDHTVPVSVPLATPHLNYLEDGKEMGVCCIDAVSPPGGLEEDTWGESTSASPGKAKRLCSSDDFDYLLPPLQQRTQPHPQWTRLMLQQQVFCTRWKTLLTYPPTMRAGDTLRTDGKARPPPIPLGHPLAPRPPSI
jgi:hypothetical protein